MILFAESNNKVITEGCKCLNLAWQCWRYICLAFSRCKQNTGGGENNTWNIKND